MSDALLALGDGLAEAGGTHVALAATGVDGQPLDTLREDRCTLLLVNARPSKAMPGRKTAVRACAWSAARVPHGLRRPRCVPARPAYAVRARTRSRTSLVRARARGQPPAADAGGATRTLSRVASDVPGTSGRARHAAARVAGPPHAATLAALAQGTLRAQRGAVERARSGRGAAQQRCLLAARLGQRDDLSAPRTRVRTAIAERVRPGAADLARLAAIGTAMTRFPTARQLAAWAGMCPGKAARAGKRRRAP